ncbi:MULTISPECIES: phosphomannomutase/phosphoglucomutase [Acinetobacter]|uniref:phosphomannomutase n=1 Tax=Acinetobacter lwoffii NIPH 478 TaxID=1217668 RepID=N9G5S0_ACILW|nr:MULTISPECIES: phosphomannomutase/phosphoglucomutase [Acinetobacter]KGH49150.1 phosphomannomutase [Acinetobacter idrijaensis]ODN55516.1 phosphomannomutase [Acinetobacter sp. 51m]RDC52517.1 phosphomannomutase/phosphoglucomutase [Acinetobacter sp. RIT592]AUC05837.1 phosphomannomutase/phosphoglucomutase [Acinetobacter lwoffii]EEY90447.1 phosphoglucomutase/phosphomannomutase, alpha/beta/alpha domain II [Acinetobacter lwoffii SH145]
MGSMNHPFPMHIFRAYDIRGKVSLLGAGIIDAIAHGLAQQYQAAGQTRVAIGYDARISSPAFADIIARIFKDYSLEATIIGCCSSPMLYFTARQFDGNGIMVTASHNPKEDNGIKWIIDGEPPCPEMIQQVAQLAKSHCDSQLLGLAELPHQIIPEFCLQYQQGILEDIQLKRSFKVILDGLHGSAGRCADLVLRKMGCEVTALRCEANGHFPDHAPDPSQDKHLETLRQTVMQQQADLGIALDGDGDRLVLVDEQGQIITADQLLCLFAEICLSDSAPRQFVYDVKCSTLVRDTVQRLGGEPVMIRTGSSFLRTYLNQSQHQAIFGGEYAGHYVFNDGRGWGYDDGLYAALRVMEYLDQTGQTLAQALAAYPKRHGTEDLYISTRQVRPVELLNFVEQQSARINAQISKIDGIRLDFEDGFGIIRASNTGEYFTVRFDANNAQGLNEIRHLFVAMLRDRYPEIAQDILDAQ